MYYTSVPISYVTVGLQKVGKFPLNFENVPEILESFRILMYILHPFATLCDSTML